MEIIFKFPSTIDISGGMVKVFNYHSWPAQTELKRLGFDIFVTVNDEIHILPGADFSRPEKRTVVEIQTQWKLDQTTKAAIMFEVNNMLDNMFRSRDKIGQATFKFFIVDFES